MNIINFPDKGSSNKEQILTVSALNQKARNFLEKEFFNIKVEGEISDLTKHRSGHWYFSLKDEESQFRAAMFRSQNSKVKFNIKEGDQVILSGKLSVYSPRGSYQFITETMKQSGEGYLQQKFELLKKELSNRGFFEENIKSSLPFIPEQVVIITSPQGAAIRDMITTFKRRFPLIKLIVFPVPVQGDEAAKLISEAIIKTNKYNNLNFKEKLQFRINGEDVHFSPDAIIIGRGGGDLEDLWAFNEMVVAEAIFKSKIPIISAVGHETDTTISDLVADVRAPTPTAAAELLSPEVEYIQHRFKKYFIDLNQQIKFYLNQTKLTLKNLKKGLKHPDQILKQNAQRIDQLDNDLNTYVNEYILNLERIIKQLEKRLLTSSPIILMNEKKLQHNHLKKQLQKNIKSLMNNKNQKWIALMEKLNIVNPLATLDRGYSITSSKENKIISSIKNLKVGQRIFTKLSDGKIKTVIEEID